MNNVQFAATENDFVSRIVVINVIL